jgi:tRNA pseudouridine38-40 synthase
MAQACRCLIGSHDFAAFGQPPHGSNTVREVYQAECYREGAYVYVVVEANAFLYRMMRSIVGTLLRVGTGGLTPGDFERILQARDRRLAAQTAPPHGLCLVRVNY